MKVYTKEEITKKKNKRQKLNKIVKIVFEVIFAIFVILCLYIAYQKFILKSPNVELFGYKTYVVLTGSMKPTLNPNDVVIVKKQDKKNINNGDIITYTVGNTTSTVTHRIIEIVEEDGKKYYKTKGDNNNAEDSDLIPYEDVQGKFCFKISKVGAVLTGGLTGTGIIVIFLILALSYHQSSKREDRRLTREEARKKYNVYKYGKNGEDANDTI